MFRYIIAHKRGLLYTPLFLYWLLILVLTSLPARDLPSVDLGDKIEHILAFFGLGFLLNFALHFEKKFPLLNKYPAISTFILGALYAAFDEIHQLLIPGRTCDILDWTADSLGLLLGITFINLLLKYFPYKER